MDIQLTDEQLAIIHHPLGKHARVLAVAGSGKTTTMVQRVKYLVEECHQDPNHIRVVMFNRLARGQFLKQLEEQISESTKRPKVLTFHSLAYRLRFDAEKKGLIPQYKELWVGDKAEMALICMFRAIDSLLREGIIEEDVDPKEALDTVGLWKASLIPPERAGHRTNLDLPLVYQRFEELREKERALTFDDFVPKALQLLDKNPGFKRRWTNHLKHLIVDEYQDINYGQQKLIQLLAGNRADVMVVGDDDQTIYEWRAARPYYILEGFKKDFANKPIFDYSLSRSFRFGPLLAQCAYNTIVFNGRRKSKPLVAHSIEKYTGITILSGESEQATNIAVSIAQEITTLVREHRVPPEKIGVLGRTFAQLEGLQTVFTERKIPFRVIGMGPFFERDENRTLIDYIRLALALEQPIGSLRPWSKNGARQENEESAQGRSPRRALMPKGPYSETVRAVLAVANTPSRRLARSALQRAVKQGGSQGKSTHRVFEILQDQYESPLPTKSRENLQELLDFLMRIAERVVGEPDLRVGNLLQWIIDSLDYKEHFISYYGEGIASFERIASIDNFVEFASRINQSPREFLSYLQGLDTTWGLSEDRVITMTTVHRTKGLEYDYVFIPACVEGRMPVQIAEESVIYDKTGSVPEQPPSPVIESERRLFYVAVTRAKKHLYIGTVASPPSGQQSQATAPLPSRFLAEMDLKSTRTVISAGLEMLQNGDGHKLLAIIDKGEGRRSMIRYVAENYLRSSELFDPVMKSIEQMSETDFEYPYDYPDLGQESSKHKELKPVPWSDPWAGIGALN